MERLVDSRESRVGTLKRGRPPPPLNRRARPAYRFFPAFFFPPFIFFAIVSNPPLLVGVGEERVPSSIRGCRLARPRDVDRSWALLGMGREHHPHTRCRLWMRKVRCQAKWQ